MRKVASFALALILVLCIILPAGAAPKVQNLKPKRVMDTDNGAFIFVTRLVPGTMEFSVGWNNGLRFDSIPTDYRVILYDVQTGQDVWWFRDTGNYSSKEPVMRVIDSFEWEPVSGIEYRIEFTIMDYENHAVEDFVLAVLHIQFTAP